MFPGFEREPMKLLGRKSKFIFFGGKNLLKKLLSTKTFLPLPVAFHRIKPPLGGHRQKTIGFNRPKALQENGNGFSYQPPEWLEFPLGGPGKQPFGTFFGECFPKPDNTWILQVNNMSLRGTK